MPANPLNTIVEITQEQFDHAAAIFAEIQQLQDGIQIAVDRTKQARLRNRRDRLIKTRQALLALNGEQYEAITRFASERGREWKSILRAIWATGNYDAHRHDGALLQQIRNVRGLQWLENFRTVSR